MWHVCVLIELVVRCTQRDPHSSSLFSRLWTSEDTHYIKTEATHQIYAKESKLGQISTCHLLRGYAVRSNIIFEF